MKGLSQFASIVLLIFTFVELSSQTEYVTPDSDICRLFADGAKLRKPGTCDQQIICQNFQSTDGIDCRTESKNIYYDSSSAKCVSKEPSDSYCKAPCAKTSPSFVTDKKNCQNYYACNGKTELARGSCPDGQLFDQKAQKCVYKEASTCVATFEFCDVAEKGLKFKDENNCHKYYKCESKLGKSGLVLTSYECDAGLYYDVASKDCIAKAQVDCYKHPYPVNVCGTTKLAFRDRFMNDKATCRGYFYCRDLGVGVPDTSPSWGQCPVSEFFDEQLQACVPRSEIKCFEDRCDGRVSGYELSGTYGCQHYLECKDNITLGEYFCGENSWFDVDTLQCTNLERSYPACM